MDLSRFDTREKAHEGVDVPLVIDGETVLGLDDKPITFRIKGAADPELQRVIMASVRSPAKTPEEMEAQDMKVIRAAVVGWSGNWTMEGEEPIPFSREAVAKVFSIPAIRRAIMPEIGRDAHFMKGA